MSTRRPKMPTFDENAPLLLSHRPSLNLMTDSQGFAIPAAPPDRPERLRTSSASSTGKKVVPKSIANRGLSVSMSSQVAKRDIPVNHPLKEGERDSFWGEVSLNGSEGNLELLGKLERRLKSIEVGLKGSTKRVDDRLDDLQIQLTDIKTDLILQTQTSNGATVIDHDRSFPSSSRLVSGRHDLTGIANDQVFASNRVFPDITEFGSYDPTLCGSPPVPALLSRKKREMALRRMSSLNSGDRSGCEEDETEYDTMGGRLGRDGERDNHDLAVQNGSEEKEASIVSATGGLEQLDQVHSKGRAEDDGIRIAERFVGLQNKLGIQESRYIELDNSFAVILKRLDALENTSTHTDIEQADDRSQYEANNTEGDQGKDVAELKLEVKRLTEFVMEVQAGKGDDRSKGKAGFVVLLNLGLLGVILALIAIKYRVSGYLD